jgi:tetratricopeptide (TPR) repeat protein
MLSGGTSNRLERWRGRYYVTRPALILACGLVISLGPATAGAEATPPKAPKAAPQKAAKKARKKPAKKVAAPAKKKPSKADAKLAKAAYIKGQRLFKADEFELALPLFRQAYELSQHKPSAIFGLAQVERMLKMYDAAVGHFEELLATKPKASIVKRVNQTLDILKTQREQARIRAAKAEKARVAAAKIETERREKEAEAMATKLAEKIVAPPPKKPTLWDNPWVWVGVGVVVAGASIGTTYALVGSQEIYSGTTDTVFEPQ